MTVFTWKGEKDTITIYGLHPLLQTFLQSGLMSMEPQTGNIKAWVGGINYKYFQYDHVGQVPDRLDPHLAFVYATAIEQLNMSPCIPL
jgi:penicillin-binding protein 1A